jgi:hypothetical protein
VIAKLRLEGPVNGLYHAGATDAPQGWEDTCSAAGAASWRVVKQLRGGAFPAITAVVTVGRNGGWAFDGQGSPTAWERNGSAWSRVSFPGQSNEVVVAAAATSASDVWAFTGDGGHSRALRWNGSKWSVAGTFSRGIGGAAAISASDVWVFGQPFVPGSGLGAWHDNGHSWSRVAGGGGLEGGSAVSASDVWAFDGTHVANWNGKTWTRTSVAHLLPGKQQLNDPAVTGIYAQSRNSVYAIANGNLQDEGGPIVVLHYNGHIWAKLAEGNYGFGTQPLQQIASDGHGGLWLPMPGVAGQKSYLLHYSAGHLTVAALPASASKINVDAVALIPGTTDLLGGGFTHAAGNPGANVVAVILRYSR